MRQTNWKMSPWSDECLNFLGCNELTCCILVVSLVKPQFPQLMDETLFKIWKKTRPHSSQIAHSVSSLQFSQPEFFAFWNNRDTECKHVNSINHTEVKFGFPATSLLISLFQIVLQFLVAITDGVEERVVTVRCALLPLLLIRL